MLVVPGKLPAAVLIVGDGVFVGPGVFVGMGVIIMCGVLRGEDAGRIVARGVVKIE